MDVDQPDDGGRSGTTEQEDFPGRVAIRVSKDTENTTEAASETVVPSGNEEGEDGFTLTADEREWFLRDVSPFLTKKGNPLRGGKAFQRAMRKRLASLANENGTTVASPSKKRQCLRRKDDDDDTSKSSVKPPKSGLNKF